MFSQRIIIRSILRYHVPKIRLVKHFRTESAAGRYLRQADETSRKVEDKLDKLDSKIAIIYGFTAILVVGGVGCPRSPTVLLMSNLSQNAFNFYTNRHFETELRTDMNNLRTELRSDMKDMKAELKSAFKVQFDTILALLVKRDST
ncbi:hypothetical protein L211DRAFT_845848 [Terfezia boudieri ATCC MYA-4762]|uniref:Uncharacterized protein n=1 Tax=Terfezia boudieri ATCC MYA-4762 TaxID=1051890 RepID=A0A3N4LY72_9PEZI|nr:hypothetical protein L211DRAFT_845848 [Terfezia boudieri ATCC MYA-4762]